MPVCVPRLLGKRDSLLCSLGLKLTWNSCLIHSLYNGGTMTLELNLRISRNLFSQLIILSELISDKAKQQCLRILHLKS